MNTELPHNDHVTVVPNDHLRAFIECAQAAAAAIGAIDQRESQIARLYLKAALKRLEALGIMTVDWKE